MRVAPVASSSRMRAWLIWVPTCSSIHMLAPAPQHIPLFPLLGHDLETAEAAHHPTGRQVDVVVASQVARVVVDEPLLEPGACQIEPAVGDERLSWL